MSKKLTTEEFIEKARKIHEDKYDYSKVEYIKSIIKVCIICPLHGEFWQKPNGHISSKNGCKKCANLLLNLNRKLSFEEYVEKANREHNFKYKYPFPYEYQNLHSKLTIICDKHGVFKQQAQSHLRNEGCKKCKTNIIFRKYKDLNEIINNLVNSNINLYEYDLTYFENNYPIILIKCKKHNDWFEQDIHRHIKGAGCNRCAGTSRNLSRILDRENILKTLKRENYEYLDFKNKHLIIRCIKHDYIFNQYYHIHFKGAGCPKCSKANISKPEIEVQEFVKSLRYDIITNSKKIISPYEIDIHIPSLNKAIEFNGLYWHYDHSNKNCKPKGYHAQKSNLCREKGIRLLHVREDLWLKDKEKIKQVILKFLQK